MKMSENEERNKMRILIKNHEEKHEKIERKMNKIDIEDLFALNFFALVQTDFNLVCSVDAVGALNRHFVGFLMLQKYSIKIIIEKLSSIEKFIKMYSK